MINLWFGTKEELEKRAKTGCFSERWAVICFYGKDEQPVDLSKHEAEYICAYLEDFGALGSNTENKKEFFPDADRIADMVIRAVAEGKALYFQEDTRGLSCAAAVLEFFTGGGMQVFGRVRYRTGEHCLDVKIYEKLYGALCCAKLMHNDIDFDSLRTGRAAFNRKEMISKIYDLMFEEAVILKVGEDKAKELRQDDEEFKDEETETEGGITITVKNGIRAGSLHNEVFAFTAVTKDKISHYYCGFLFSELLVAFLDKYTKDDIEYFGVQFWHSNNDYGAAHMDSECGASFTTEHLRTYHAIIDDKFGVKEQDVYD